MDSLNQEVQEAHHQELSTSQTRHQYLLPLVTQVVVQTILVVVAVVTLAPSVVTAVRQADMVLTVGNSMQEVLEAMGLEEI